MVGVFERVFETGPVFRAEPHETARHLAEYVSLDAELGFIGDHRDVMDVVARCVRAMIAAVGQPVPESIPVVHFTDVRRGDEPDLAPDRGLEIVSGGQRLHRYKDYLAALAARDLDLAPFAGYLDAFRSGMPPHGGFGLGLERFMAQATGV